MDTVAIAAPAKLNLFLAVTGRRPDGFHDLVSVAAPLDFGDTLRAELAATTSLACDDPEIPRDDSNLVLQAARAFARVTGWAGGVRFTLEKRIPMGAGLGGGSSDAVAALRALNRLAGPDHALDARRLAEVAGELGSDCPLFLAGGPVVMRGRGERVEGLPPDAIRRLRGRSVLVCKPGFGVSTPWAYGRLAAAAPGSYLPPAEAEARLAEWLADPAAPAESLCFNTMEPPVFEKFLALPTLREQLRRELDVALAMSGSGSACFVLPRSESEAASVAERVRTAWGPSTFVRAARIA